MKKSIRDFSATLSLWCRYSLLFIFMGSGLAMPAQGQYYTSTSSNFTNTSLIPVQRYSKTVPQLRRIISIHVKKEPVKKILGDIIRKADLGIAYNAGLKALNKKISVNLDRVTVADALEHILAETRFEPVLTRMGEVMLKKRAADTRLTLAMKIQQEISGSVKDAATGDPLPGVNVLVVGTTTGTSTNEKGAFSLSVPDDADSLRFSFIGYSTQTVAINDRRVINVSLSPQVQAFDQMVVTALGINRKERSIGYSTQQIEGENLSYSNENNVIGSLAGKVAGVQVSGSPSMGGTETIKIRGINSIGGQEQPLIVIDGTPISNQNFTGAVSGPDYGNLAQDINPNDIKSVNILKGPAASALYGIRGQYGVVMITTKDGADAKGFKVEINSNFSLQQATNFMPLQNKYGGGYQQEWKTLPNGQKYVEMNADESWGPKMDGTEVRQYYSFYPQDPNYGQTTPFVAHPNNIKNFFETGYTSDQGLTISGGGENSNYRLSFNDTKIGGIYPNSQLHRNNLGISTGIDVSDKWRFSTNLNYMTNSARRPPQTSAGGSRSFRSWHERQLDMNKLKQYQYSDGTYMNWNLRTPSSSTGEISNLSPLYWSNPYFDAYESISHDERDRLFGDVGVKFDALPGLVFSGYIRGDMYAQGIEGKTGFGGVDTPEYTTGKYKNKEMNYELSGQYKRSWEGFSLEATVGANLYDRDYSYLYQETVGGLTTPGYFNIEASVDRPINNSYKLEKKIFSTYGMVSLGYNDAYFVDLSLRNDKSSTLPKDNNSYWYPSVSGSFVFSEFVHWDALTFGKLRLSYARAGSDLNPYQTSPSYNIGSVYGSINTLTTTNNINNPNIKPSFSTSYEAGIDVKFFGRVGLNLTYYQQKNKDQIIPLNISGTSGYSSATINAGLIENKGIEFSLSGTPIQSRQFSWESTFNFSKNRNEVVELYSGINVYTQDQTSYSTTPSYLNSYVGKSFGSLVGRAYQRDEETGKILLDDNNLPMWTDATHNFGTVLPDFTGGFQNVFHYKNFNLAAMIDFQSGGQFFSRTKLLTAKTGIGLETVAMNDKGHNVRDPIADGGGVKVEGISNSTGNPVTAYVDAYDYFHLVGDEVYEDWVYDASYIKLSQVRLGYTFSGKALKNIPVNSIRVALYTSNPLMIWQAAPQGLDPSKLATGRQDIPWYEAGQANTVRTYGLNVKLTF